MADSYREWQVLKAPPWLQGANGGPIEAELGGMKDDFLDRARLGVLAMFPGAVTRESPPLDPANPTPVAPADALEQIGADRIAPRAPSETDAAYAARLQAAWETEAILGGPLGLLNELKLQGYTGGNIIQDNGRYWFLTGSTLTSGTLMTMATRGRAGWQFDCLNNHDVTGDLWSRFALLFAADVSDLGSAAGWAKLNSIVERWRPGISTYMGAYVLLTGHQWGWPTSTTWGQASLNWGSSTCRFIPPDGNPAITV